MQKGLGIRVMTAVAIVLAATLAGLAAVPPFAKHRLSPVLLAIGAGPLVPVVQFWRGSERVFYAPSLLELAVVEVFVLAAIFWYWKSRTTGSFVVALIFWVGCGLLFGIVIWI